MTKKSKTLSKTAQKMLAPILSELIVARMVATKDPQQHRDVEFAKRSVVSKMLGIDMSMLALALDDLRDADRAGDAGDMAYLAQRYAYWCRA